MQWSTDYEEMTILRYVLIIHIIMKVNTIKRIVDMNTVLEQNAKKVASEYFDL